ncbi:MAG: CGNR zinc finger domain-containing protein [Nocardioidaceae bacterium]
MHINPYGRDPVRMMVGLANNPPNDLAELAGHCRAAGVSLDLTIGDDDLAATLALIDRWCEIVDADDEAERASLLNRLLAEASTYPRMRNHGDEGWHLHYRDDDVPLADVIRALVSVGTALHLVGRGMHTIGRCALAECVTIYADTSRAGRQRYGSPRCSNRDAVRRHRARHAAAG